MGPTAVLPADVAEEVGTAAGERTVIVPVTAGPVTEALSPPEDPVIRAEAVGGEAIAVAGTTAQQVETAATKATLLPIRVAVGAPTPPTIAEVDDPEDAVRGAIPRGELAVGAVTDRRVTE